MDDHAWRLDRVWDAVKTLRTKHEAVLVDHTARHQQYVENDTVLKDKLKTLEQQVNQDDCGILAQLQNVTREVVANDAQLKSLLEANDTQMKKLLEEKLTLLEAQVISVTPDHTHPDGSAPLSSGIAALHAARMERIEQYVKKIETQMGEFNQSYLTKGDNMWYQVTAWRRLTATATWGRS